MSKDDEPIEGDYTRHIEASDVLAAGEHSLEEWKQKLQDDQDEMDDAFSEAIPPLLKFAEEIAEFKGSAQSVAGGTDFSAKMKEWCDLSSQDTSQLASIGEDSKLPEASGSLPPSPTALVALTKLEPEEFDAALASGAINPKMSVAQARALAPASGGGLTRVTKTEAEKRKASMNRLINGFKKLDLEAMAEVFEDIEYVYLAAKQKEESDDE